MNPLSILELARQATYGEISDEQAHSLIQVGTGKQGLFKDGVSLPVLDANGDPLIAGERYLFKNGRFDKNPKPVLVTKATFGAGNIADTYYRVFYYSGETLEESFTVVNGKGSPFTGFTYKGDFTPID